MCLTHYLFSSSLQGLYRVGIFNTGRRFFFFLLCQHNEGDNKIKGVEWEIELTAGDVPFE